MKMTLKISILLIFTFNLISSQDTILLKNNSKLLVENIEVGLRDVKYKNFLNRDGITFSVDKLDVDYIIFSNGYRQKIEVYETKRIIDTSVIYVTNDPNDIYLINVTNDNNVTKGVNDLPRNLFTQGQVDAAKFYKGYRVASTGTLVIALLSPIVGLIPAIACSATTPKSRNLDYPDSQLFQTIDYQHGYVSQSKRIKSKKVWRNWGIALGTNVILVLMTQQYNN